MKSFSKNIVFTLVVGLLAGWGISYTNCGQVEQSQNPTSTLNTAAISKGLTNGESKSVITEEFFEEDGVMIVNTSRGSIIVPTSKDTELNTSTDGLIFTINNSNERKTAKDCEGSCSGTSCATTGCMKWYNMCGCSFELGCGGSCGWRSRAISETKDAETKTYKGIKKLTFEDGGVTLMSTNPQFKIQFNEGRKTYDIIDINTGNARPYATCTGDCNGGACNSPSCSVEHSICGCSINTSSDGGCGGSCDVELLRDASTL